MNEINIMSISIHPNITEYIEAYLWGGSGGRGTKVSVASLPLRLLPVS
jgi:hypothetical protein